MNFGITRPPQADFDEPKPDVRHAYGPGVFTPRAQRMVAVADCIAIVAAALIAAFTHGRKNASAIVVATILTPLSLAACARYTHSFANAPQDECYAMTVPGLVALGGFFSLSAIPGVALDRVTGLAALGYGFAGCAGLRALLHQRVVRLNARSNGARVVRARGAVGAAIKRIVDVLLTAAVTPAAALVGAGVALAIVLDGGGPVFFVQERVGRNGRPFKLYKFRSMRAAAGDAWAIAGDPRVTRIGRFLRATSLDELPQLANVLRGEMSLVGPRPEMPMYAERFAQRLPHYYQRLYVKPGITGWAQVTLPRVLTDDDMASVLSADLFYIANASLVFDGAIIAKTAIEVLFHRVA